MSMRYLKYSLEFVTLVWLGVEVQNVKWIYGIKPPKW